MNEVTLPRLFLALFVVLLTATGCQSVESTPETPTPEPDLAPENLLLRNPDFDPPYVAQSFVEGVSASPWLLAWCDACPAPERLSGGNPEDLVMGRPQWQSGDEEVCGEETCQQWFSTYRTSYAGVYQLVQVPEDSTCRFGARVKVIASNDGDFTDSEFPNSDARQTITVRLVADPNGGIAFWEFEEDTQGEFPLRDDLVTEQFGYFHDIYDEFVEVEMTFESTDSLVTVGLFSKVTWPIQHPATVVDRAWLFCE